MDTLTDRREGGSRTLVLDESDGGVAGAGRIDEDTTSKITTDESRRKALQAIAGLSLYVAPSMTVLLPGTANAHHEPWHQSAGNGGNNCKGWAVGVNCSAF